MTILPFEPTQVGTVFVNFSGGKDSLAALLRALQVFPRQQVIAIFNDTGAEAPETYEYLRMFNTCVFPVRRLAERIVGQREDGSNILELVQLRWDEPCGARGALTLLDLIYQDAKRRPTAPGWPSPSNRYCTRALKKHVTDKFIRAAVPDMQVRKRCILAMGVRREESASRANTPEWLFDFDLGIGIWQPIADWSRDQVLAFIARRGVPLNPVYERAGRANCVTCFFARESEVIDHEVAHPGLLTPYVLQEHEIGTTWKAGRSLETVQKIAQGEIPRQMMLLDAPSQGESCMSGFCDVA